MGKSYSTRSVEASEGRIDRAEKTKSLARPKNEKCETNLIRQRIRLGGREDRLPAELLPRHRRAAFIGASAGGQLLVPRRGDEALAGEIVARRRDEPQERRHHDLRLD